MNVEYETIIGLEVHAQLMTKSKMYCGCSTDYASTPPNTHVCPICLGMPGVLPVINRQAIEYAIMTALALSCTISEHSKFDRKNYPYPDLMKGYQISQYDAPIGVNGSMTIEIDGQEKRIGITRVHMEEDVAKLIHRATMTESYSLVDVNRSGVPLMEIVSEPDLRSPEEARQYLTKLHNILQYLGVSTANMEEGSFRCDANISIRAVGTKELMPKVEVKNMNSFRAVHRAMEFEAVRQRKAAAASERIVQETRGWVEEKGQTVSQRTKEYAHDYRYFPEPDLPPMVLDRKWVEQIRERLPELPEAKRERFVKQYGLPAYDANLLTTSKAMADFFEELVKMQAASPKDTSNRLLGSVSALLNARNIDITEFLKHVSVEDFAGLVRMESNVVNANVTAPTAEATVTSYPPGVVITSSTARLVLDEMYDTGKNAEVIVREKGLGQISDAQAIADAVDRAVKSNPKALEDFRAGKESALKFLVGQVMRATRGRANPQMVNDLLKKKLAGE